MTFLLALVYSMFKEKKRGKYIMYDDKDLGYCIAIGCSGGYPSVILSFRSVVHEG